MERGERDMRELAKSDGTLKKILPAQKLHPDTEYVRSQFTLPFSHEGRHFVYSTLTRQLWELDQPLGERFTASEIEADKDLTTLMKGYFLVPEGKDECVFYEGLSRMLRALKKPKGIRGYTILPTLACNARCVYCYEEGMKPVTMTPEIVEQTVQYILRTKAEGKIEIGWFGGEPLLGEMIIDRICERLQDEGVEYASHLITNGSLLTEAIADKISETWKVVRAQISMDGEEKDYINRKKYLQYQDNYRTAMQAVNLLVARNIQVSIRCNVDAENFDGLPQFLSDLSEIILNKEKVHLYLAPLYASRTGDGDLAIWEKVMSMERQIHQAGFGAFAIKERENNLRLFHCMADAGNVVISPDGSLYACEHFTPDSLFGDIWHGITDETGRKNFCCSDQTREMCYKCCFLPDCTSFSNCPVQDTHCRENRIMQLNNNMIRMINAAEDDAQDDGQIPVC